MRDDHINIHKTCLIFLSIPINLLLWGWKPWALHKTLLSSLEVFLIQSIQIIPGISMEQVINLQNRELIQSLRQFSAFPPYVTTIAIHQLTFDIFFKNQRQTTHPQRSSPYGASTIIGAAAFSRTNKKLIVKNLQLIIATTYKGQISLSPLGYSALPTRDTGIDLAKHTMSTPRNTAPPPSPWEPT